MRVGAMKGWMTTVVLSATLLLTGCGPEQVNLEGKTMGTSYSIRYVTGDDTPSAGKIQAEIDKRLELVNDQMSTYRPGSELSAALEQRRAWTGIDKLSVQGNALVKRIPELYVDLSSIAKGYGVDVIAEYLQSQQVKNYMVDIGGEVRTRGHNGENKPWRIAIERPTAGMEQKAQLVIQPGEMSIATSGDYRNYFEQDGVRYSHTIDPITGRPIHHHLVSVTVLSPTCMAADGLSTGLNVLGPERGMALANLMGIPVFMIVKTATGFEERYSEAFKPYLNKHS